MTGLNGGRSSLIATPPPLGPAFLDAIDPASAVVNAIQVSR